MGNPFKKMEKEHRENLKITIDWKSLSSERSIEIPRFLEILKEFKPPTVLDIGFAGGFYQQDILNMKDIKYVGIDYDISRINGKSLYISADRKIAWKELLNKFSWFQEDILNPSEELCKRKFHMVVSISTIEHLVPAGYASNYSNLNADLKAVKNMKKLVRDDGSLLLTFPVGQEKYFYNPDINRNARILQKTGLFKKGQHDQIFYNSDRIEKLIDGWNIIEKRFWKKTNGQWFECSEKIACNVDHKTSEARTVCILHIRRK